MKRIAAAIAAAALICGLAWLGGYDFDQRSPMALLIAYFALTAAWVAYGVPGK